MSVRVENRQLSKSQYIETARQICKETLYFASRLSARYARLLANDIMATALEIYDNAMKADSVYHSDDIRLALREEYFLRGRAACDSLDAKLGIALDVLLENPQGCFTKSDGKTDVDPSEAKRKIGNLMQRLGDLLSEEHDAFTALLKALKKDGA